MFEEASDDGMDGDVFAHVFDAWAETAEASDDEVDFDACVGGLVECFGDGAVFEGIHFGDDACGFPCFGVGDFGVDELVIA